MRGDASIISPPRDGSRQEKKIKVNAQRCHVPI